MPHTLFPWHARLAGGARSRALWQAVETAHKACAEVSLERPGEVSCAPARCRCVLRAGRVRGTTFLGRCEPHTTITRAPRELRAFLKCPLKGPEPVCRARALDVPQAETISSRCSRGMVACAVVRIVRVRSPGGLERAAAAEVLPRPRQTCSAAQRARRRRGHKVWSHRKTTGIEHRVKLPSSCCLFMMRIELPRFSCACGRPTQANLTSP